MQALLRNILFCFLVLGQVSISFGQQATADTISRPVIRHAKNSNLPAVLTVEGKIVKITFGMCGIFCYGSTAKVALSSKVPGYKYSYAYLVIPCLESEPEDSIIKVKATRLNEKEKECYYNNIRNTIDSRGIPFYKIDEKQAATIKQTVRTTAVWRRQG